MVLLDVLMLTEGRVTSDYEHFVDGLGLVWLPALSANVLYHYLSGRYGALPNIAYRLIILLYPYVVPFAPQMSDALLAFARIFLPMGILLLIHTLYTPKVFVETMRKRRIQSALTAVFTIAALLFVMLISGQFRYKALVVATESMAGAIDKGDAVIYEKYDDQYIQKEQIIVFERNDATIIHRVKDIKKINGQMRYFTKGDANEGMDSGYITDENVVGIINLKIKYVGYPTIWVRSLFE